MPTTSPSLSARGLAVYSVALLALLALSGIRPLELDTWAMEVAPVFIALPLLWLSWRRFPLTPLVYALIFVHALVLMLGGHYTYAQLLLRHTPLRPGAWLFTLVVAVCGAISALYELIEWGAAVAIGAGAEAFLGTQGDPWDTQKDMALAFIGAMAAQWLLARWHDAQLARVALKPPGA